MRTVFVLLIYIGTYMATTTEAVAQAKPQMEAKLAAEENEEPLIFKFDPNYEKEKEARRKEIMVMTALIDTLDISENKRRKLIRDLYMNEESRRLKKIILATTEFEEDIEN